MIVKGIRINSQGYKSCTSYLSHIELHTGWPEVIANMLFIHLYITSNSTTDLYFTGKFQNKFFFVFWGWIDQYLCDTLCRGLLGRSNTQNLCLLSIIIVCIFPFWEIMISLRLIAWVPILRSGNFTAKEGGGVAQKSVITRTLPISKPESRHSNLYCF